VLCSSIRQTTPFCSFWDISANQTVANATVATITWNRTRYGTSLLTWDVATNSFKNNQSFSILVSMNCTASWGGISGGFRVLFFDHSIYGRVSFSDIPNNGGEYVGQVVSTTILLTAGASISTKVYQNRGGTLDLVNNGVGQTQLFFTEIPLA